MNFHRMKDIRDVIQPPEHLVLRVSNVTVGTIHRRLTDCSKELSHFDGADIPQILENIEKYYNEYTIERNRHIWLHNEGTNSRYSLSFLLRKEFNNSSNFTHTMEFVEYNGVYYKIRKKMEV